MIDLKDLTESYAETLKELLGHFERLEARLALIEDRLDSIEQKDGK